MISHGTIPVGFTPENREAIQATLRAAVQAALLAHKRAGLPIVVWENGKVVKIPANEIPVEDPLKAGDQP
jgi:hypothetical protein